MTARFEPAADLAAVVDAAAREQYRALAEHLVIAARHNVNPDTGHYASTVHTFDDDRGVGAEASDIAAHIIEWGSTKTEAQHPMTRAGDEIGRKVGRFEAK